MYNSFSEKEQWEITSNTCMFENDTIQHNISAGTTSIKV